MNLNLEGKNAWVGGSSKGIGWATAVELAYLGANITLVGRNETTLKQKLEILPKNPYQFHEYVVADYNQLGSLKEIIDEKFSQKPYLILINNSGGPAGGNLAEESIQKFEETLGQHLLANQIILQAALPAMKQYEFGRIVNILSVSVKQPIIGLGVSNTTRYAVAAWAKTLSKEIAKYGITINNVLPGYTLTERLEEVLGQKSKTENIDLDALKNQVLSQIPVGKFATAEEVASVVAFLCSPAAASINGINLPVDGGLSMSL